MLAHEHAVQRQDVARHRQRFRWFGSKNDNNDVLIQQVFLDVTHAHARSLLDYPAVQMCGLEEFELLPDSNLTHTK